MSDLFSSKENTPSVTAVADPYQQVRQPLVNWLSQNIGQGKSYDGQLVAPATSQENQSLSALDSYANRQPSSTYTSGENAINQKLNGNYDPATSPYYQAIKAQSAQNLADTQRSIENQTAGGGQYYSGARTQNQQRATTDNANNLNTTLGALQQQNEQQKAQMAPLALQAGQNDMNAPLQTAAALQQYGSLPRAIQQALDQANYQNWQSANIQQPLAIGQLAAGVQQPPVYAQNSYSPSPFSSLVSGPLGQAGLGAVSSGISNLFAPNYLPQQTQAFGGGTSQYQTPSTSFMNGPLSLSGF